MDSKKNNKKFSIIEPFLKKEKKLKEIEEESSISYATLKRWVSQYKNSGLEGLEKKERVDKSKSKKLSNEAMTFLKDLYHKNHSLPLTQLYEKAKSTLEEYNSMISYPTFFRIINNLDENVRDKSIDSINKLQIFEYGLYQRAIPIPFFNNKNMIFYLTIYFNKETFQIINFLFEEEQRELGKLLNFIEQSIEIEGEFPKNIAVDPFINGFTKTIFRNIYFNTNINLIKEETNSELKRSVKYLDMDILREFNKNRPKNIDDIRAFIKKYFFIKNIDKDKKEILELKYLNELKYLLEKKNRKVYSYGVRVKNKIYFHQKLEVLQNEVVEVFYNEFNEMEVLIFYKNSFVGKANLVTEESVC